MKKKLLLMFAVVTAVLSIMVATANAASVDDLTINSDGQITKCSTDAEGELVIPSEINGIQVKGIRAMAFYNQTGLTSIILPEGVTEIGSRAFYRCTGLTSVEIPNSVIYIGVVKEVF